MSVRTGLDRVDIVIRFKAQDCERNNRKENRNDKHL